jgi:hypothetical protein
MGRRSVWSAVGSRASRADRSVAVRSCSLSKLIARRRGDRAGIARLAGGVVERQQMLLSHRRGKAGLGDEGQSFETTGEPVGVGEVMDDEAGLARLFDVFGVVSDVQGR